jgi:hypothetical protein
MNTRNILTPLSNHLERIFFDASKGAYIMSSGSRFNVKIVI